MARTVYTLDPDEPRAPTQEQWDAMSARERQRVVGDLEKNVAPYAALGIPEYFILDLRAQRIVGYRLEEGRPGSYGAIVPQAGRWSSQVLGLDLVMDAGRVRFYAGSAELLETDEFIGRLTRMVDRLVRREEELAQALEEERRRSARLADRLRALGVDPDDV